MKRTAVGKATVRVGGYTLQVDPVPDPTVPGYSTCHGSVTSAQGTIVFEQDDWGMEIDPITGRDVNGGGQPDVVLIDYSGGAHCCWTYYIVSLGTHPGLIRKFENRDSASFSDLSDHGEIDISINDGSFDGGFGLDHPFSPFPLLIVRLRGSKFEDVGSEFQAVFDKEIRDERAKLSDGELQQFLRSNPYDVHDNVAYQSTELEILSIALDYLYSGRQESARKALAQMWPTASREQAWKEMLDGYCSGLREQLGLTSSAPCGAI